MAGLIDTKYIGEERIVVALDVGTTLSAASFAYLYPDDYTRIRMVNRWHGQAEAAGSSKVPTLVAYCNGEVKACGEEAKAYTDNSSYKIAKWFKLHLHPSSMKESGLPPYGSVPGLPTIDTLALPKAVTIDQVYADFMKYLMENVRTTFEKTIPGGPAIWRRLEENRLVILTTPNGWETAQQLILTKAAVGAGLVKETTAHQLLFVTEGEASVHYALLYSQSKSWLSPGSMFAVIDAGGSTVDSTLYECKSTDPRVTLEEVCASQCIQTGGVFVDRAAEEMFQKKLEGSKFSDEESIQEMLLTFERKTKRLFNGQQQRYNVPFGGIRDTDRDHGILKGILSLDLEDVEACFAGVIDKIVQSTQTLLNGQNVQYIILVGGFGESPHLKRKLVELFSPYGASVVTAEEPSKKAAAEGALIWFIKQTVMARFAKTTIGIELRMPYDSSDPDHILRAATVFTDVDGIPTIPHVFRTLVEKGQKITTDFCHMETVSKVYASLPKNLGLFRIHLDAWYGEGAPGWTEDEEGRKLLDMRSLCTLRADLSSLQGSLVRHPGRKGGHYKIAFDVVIRLGGTQLQASVQWKEGELRREGPATVMPNAIV